jgi:hypothetical protein
MSEQVETFLERIPPATKVRECLAHNLREARLLRQILKLAEQQEKVRQIEHREEPAHA